MSTGAIVAIVIAALIVLALIMIVARRGRERRLDTRRHRAGEIRREAQLHTADADRAEAEAEERAARARREEAEARASAARAQERREEADEHHRRAAKLDPDADSDDLDAERQRVREQGTLDPTAAPDDERRVGRERAERADQPDGRADEVESQRR